MKTTKRILWGALTALGLAPAMWYVPWQGWAKTPKRMVLTALAAAGLAAATAAPALAGLQTNHSETLSA